MIDVEERVSVSLSARDIRAAKDTLSACDCDLKAVIAQFVSEISMKTPEAAAIVTRSKSEKKRATADAFELIESVRNAGAGS